MLSEWNQSQNTMYCQIPVAQACNPSYSEGRDQEDRRQPRQIVWETLSWKNPPTSKTDTFLTLKPTLSQEKLRSELYGVSSVFTSVVTLPWAKVTTIQVWEHQSCWAQWHISVVPPTWREAEVKWLWAQDFKTSLWNMASHHLKIKQNKVWRSGSSGRVPAYPWVYAPVPPNKQTKTKTKQNSRPLVAHACNPSYSGRRDQEDHSSKSTRANSSRDRILKKLITEEGWRSGSRCRPWVLAIQVKELRASHLLGRCCHLSHTPSPCNHIFHKVCMSWGINDSHVIHAGLKFPLGDVTSDTIVTLNFQFIQDQANYDPVPIWASFPWYFCVCVC
jgi:hypothetical protein